jgi:hypothetical protein
MPKNNAKTWTFISIILTLIGALMCVAGFQLDDTDWFWLIIVGFIVGLTFFILIFVFASQARRLGRLFNRQGELLAHWTFDMTQHTEKAEKEYQARKTGNRKLLLIIVAMFVIISGLFLVFAFDDISEAGFFVAIMLGALTIIILAALLAPGIAYRKMLASSPEVFIGPVSAWVMGEYTQWKAPMTRLNKVLLMNNAGSLIINIDYSILQRYGYQQHDCRIPVPAGREAEALQVATTIAGINQVQFIPPVQ